MAGYDQWTAVYDISARTVYLPDGTKLEAHSGYGDKLDDPRYVNEPMRGATPPHLYELEPREASFHGVQALRLKPIGEGGIFGRAGLLAHSYMLGPNGESNGCVSFKNYEAFLRAYENERSSASPSSRGFDPSARRSRSCELRTPTVTAASEDTSVAAGASHAEDLMNSEAGPGLAVDLHDRDVEVLLIGPHLVHEEVDRHLLSEQDRIVGIAPPMDPAVEAVAERDIVGKLVQFAVDGEPVRPGIGDDREAVAGRDDPVGGKVCIAVEEELEDGYARSGDRAVAGRISGMRRRALGEGLRQKAGAVTGMAVLQRFRVQHDVEMRQVRLVRRGELVVFP